MPDNHIAAALRAAAVCVARVECMPRYVANVEAHGTCEPGYQCICANQAAAAVAAFHRHLLDVEREAGNAACSYFHDTLAAAVEQEARNDR